jgi:hypothetical protein
MPLNGVNSGLQTALSLLSGGASRNALKFSSAYGASNKDYLNQLVSRNILSKAAQLVNDLEDARASKITFDNFLAQKQAELKTTTAPFTQKPRGSALSKLI